MKPVFRVLVALWRIVPAALVLIALAAAARAAESEPVRSPRATATLVTDTDRIAPGIPFHAGLRLRMAEGWHTYWVNPGDAGIAPELTWTLPAGATAGPIAWPAPQRQPEGSLMTYGYSGDLLLAVPVTGPAHTIRLKASWLVCKEICVPEEGEFRLDLPEGAPAASKQAPLFAAAAAAVPRPSPWTARVATDGTLTIAGEAISARSVREAWFIPAAPDTVVGLAPQPLQASDGAFSLALQPAAGFRADAPLEGVLVVRDAAGHQRALSIAATPDGPAAAPKPSPELPLWRILGLAAAGGLILNLMPCVFPVLAMKAVSLAGLSGAGRRHAAAHALSYTAGVVATFLLVGFALLALREAGDAAGWGFQFQSPAFVAAITWVLFAVGLNLSGVYEVQTAAAGIGQRLAARGGHVGSFFTGFLAVLVATPCTAPFMGVAIGAALAATSPAVTVAVFAAMGLGLATPYVVLATVPIIGRAMPRPGRWMNVLRQGLAFPMYATCVWLVWVMSQEAGSAGVLGISSGLVLIGFAGWAFGLAQRVAGRGRRFARAAALAGALAALAVLSGLAETPETAPEQATEAGVERFSPERLDTLRAEGRPVFVNMTAAWCVTCLVNERVALAQPAVRHLFAARGVVYLKGDWTRQDPQITAFLRSHGRDGVPLYALYPRGHGSPVLLPQILTEAGVIAALERLGK
jgi:thiol:disulfide interchange protein DsbD